MYIVKKVSLAYSNGCHVFFSRCNTQPRLLHLLNIKFHMYHLDVVLSTHASHDTPKTNFLIDLDSKKKAMTVIFYFVTKTPDRVTFSSPRFTIINSPRLSLCDLVAKSAE